MKEIVVLSGKGGTGKTSVTATLASMIPSLVLCDADVDAPDLHLLTQPEIRETHMFESSWTAEIDTQRCTHCGLCISHCMFGAILELSEGKLKVDPFRCEGCRLCERLCPSQAIRSHRKQNNHWFVSDTRFGPMVHAKMGIGEENSGKLVTKVRESARELAQNSEVQFLLTDGPPGTGCPAIAAITGSDHVLLVTEPTLSGLHDAKRLMELISNFKITLSVLINKADMHPQMTSQIKRYLSEKNIALAGEIPFIEDFVEAQVKGVSINEYKEIKEMTELLSTLKWHLSDIVTLRG